MDCTIRVWSPKSGLEKLKLDGHKFHQDSVICFTQHPSSKKKILISGATDCTVCLSSYETGVVFRKTEAFAAPVNSVSISDQWNVFMVSTLDGELATFDLDTFKEVSRTKEEVRFF